jgi:hypothetical protein
MIYANLAFEAPEKCQNLTDKMSAYCPGRQQFPVWHKLC